MMDQYKILRAKFVPLAVELTKAWATPESILIHLILLAAWLAAGPGFDWSTQWNFLGNQAMTIESDFVGLLILSAMIRSGDVVDAKLDVIQRDLPHVSPELVGLQHRPEEPVPLITPVQETPNEKPKRKRYPRMPRVDAGPKLGG